MPSLKFHYLLRIGPKLIGLFLLVGVVPTAVIAGISCNQASSAVDAEAKAKLGPAEAGAHI